MSSFLGRQFYRSNQYLKILYNLDDFREEEKDGNL